LNLRRMTTLLIATRNAHKVGEIRTILTERFSYLTLNDFPSAPAVVEDAGTFAGNATKKAVELAGWLEGDLRKPNSRVGGDRVWVLADDSGLEVDALNGAPGVHSARFAALDRDASGNSTDADNNAKLLRLLERVPVEGRTARFRCVLALAGTGPAPSGGPRLFEGVCEGRLGFKPQGAGGFGYDPLFLPAGRQESFAELGESLKNQISHRARALALLREFLNRCR
jgi:XTP/dITP diphosphohydrolase